PARVRSLSRFFVLPLPRPPSSLFPYTTLFRSRRVRVVRRRRGPGVLRVEDRPRVLRVVARGGRRAAVVPGASIEHGEGAEHRGEDRKSTRLNSSHGSISYAVFCLKKKTKKTQK